MIYLRLIFESFRFAVKSLIINPIRAFLSLLGVTIGIFCIIAVFTIIDSMERTIRQNMAKLGSNVVYIQKWPWAPPPGESEYPWWKYLNRPVPKLSEALELMRRSSLIQNAVFNYSFNRTLETQNGKAENTTIMGSSAGLIDAWNLEVAAGRVLSDEEFNASEGEAMIGSELAYQLFPEGSPLGKKVKVQGFGFTVIGVFKKMGEDMFGTSMDNRLLIPVKLAARLVDPLQDMGQNIIVKGKAGVSAQRLLDEMEGAMRSIRRIKPSEENNFAINEVSLISGRLDSLFRIINIAGWIIGGFAVLVGGFGIANIMFVSVRERTKIIGLQKAMGAKNRFIMLEFLFEASVLSLFGGLAGLIIIFAGTFIVSKSLEFDLVLTLGNIIAGLLISIVIGLIAGLVPARTASRLDPVVAMNTV